MSRKVYTGSLIDVVLDDGMEIVLHPPAVAIAAVDQDGFVTLTRQPRPAVGRSVLELPAGLIDGGETPLEAARRELCEETGLHGGDWAEVACLYSSPGFTDERLHLFVATGLERGEPSPEGSEQIEVVRIPLAEVAGRLSEIEDAKTLAGLLLLLHRQT